jgi:1-phosphatidylinositol-3-phosphate 5-kinase
MEEYRDDDDDDRHSIHSMATSARMPSMSDRAFLDAAMSPDMSTHAKSPFAASQLFSTNPDDTLDAIEEGVATRWDAEGGVMHRPYSPDGSDEEDQGIWTMRPNTAIPFRRPMEEDQQDVGSPGSDTASLSPPLGDETSTASTPIVEQTEEGAMKREEEISPTQPVPPRGPKRVEFPRSETISSDGGDRVALSRVDSNMPLIGLRSRLSSRTSQGGLTALIDEKGDGLWRARSNSFV